jgi:NAD(P)-dependent dehydrogenase (short-subunit alcohol dehydrogenase family)
MQLDGRVAIVTGASSGLGARFATLLAHHGATVFAAARRVDRLLELAARVDRIRVVQCDIARAPERAALVEAAHSAAGRLDVLVNNAGLSGNSRIEDEPPAILEQVIGVNLIAALDLCRLAGEAMSEGGAIVNVASILGVVAGAPLGGAAYAASKAGMIGMTRELAAQWGGRGIRVNALAPGWFHTEMTADLFASSSASAYVDRNTLLRRAGQPEELDAALLLLASDAGSYITGQALLVDGGWTAR